MSISVGIVRFFLPESKQFLEVRAAGNKSSSAAEFWMDLRKMLREEWKMSIYCIILMTWVSNILITPFPPYCYPCFQFS